MPANDLKLVSNKNWANRPLRIEDESVNFRPRDADSENTAALGKWRGVAAPDEGRFDDRASPPRLADDDDAVKLLALRSEERRVGKEFR